MNFNAVNSIIVMNLKILFILFKVSINEAAINNEYYKWEVIRDSIALSSEIFQSLIWLNYPRNYNLLVK